MSAPNELRVFISSTFRDLQEEREHLVKKVFPEIRVLCRQRGVTFTEIDLRWGLTDEEAALGRIIRTCLEEVDRCHPFFCGIVGSTYGWIPQLHEIFMDDQLIERYPWVEAAVREGKSVTELEFIQGVLSRVDAATQREGANEEVDPYECVMLYRRRHDGPLDSDSRRLESFVDRVTSCGLEFQEFVDPLELGGRVRSDLHSLIERMWPDRDGPSPDELELRAHRAFAASRRRAYIPRTEYDGVVGDSTAIAAQLTVIAGASGIGKSSLSASIAADFARKHPDALLVEHYVGATDSSTTVAGTIEHIVRACAAHFGIDDQVDGDPDALEAGFAGWLERIGRQCENSTIPALLVVDAANQLEARGRSLQWLPDALPPSIHIVTSTTDADVARELSDRGWRVVELRPIEDERVRQSIVVAYLAAFHKGIDAAHLRLLTSDAKASSPLFLRLVAEELRIHGVHETIADLVGRFIAAEDLDASFRLVLERMERDFGRDLLDSVLTAIAAARSGLSEVELLELSGLRRLELSRLLFAFDYHMLRRNGLLDFFHSYLERAVHARYLTGTDALRDRHRRLGEFFSRATDVVRRAEEEPWQWREADEPDALARCLSSPDVFLALSVPSRRYELIEYWHGLDGQHDPVEACAAMIGAARRSGVQSLTLMSAVGAFHVAGSRYRDALPIQELVYRVRHRYCGADDPATLDAADGYATALFHTGRIVEAERLWVDELTRLEFRGGPDDPSVCDVLDSLSACAYQRGRIDDMEAHLRRSLRISEATFGLDHPKSLSRLVNLAGLKLLREDVAGAADIFARVVRVATHSLGETHLDTLHFRVELARVLGTLERFDESSAMLDDVVERFEHSLGDNAVLVRALDGLGSNAIKSDRPADAEAQFRRAYDVARRIYGEHHEMTIYARCRIASAIRRQGRPYEAEAIIRELLPRQLEQWGPSHPCTRLSMLVLIQILRTTDRNEEADAWQRIRDGRDDSPKTVGDVHT